MSGVDWCVWHVIDLMYACLCVCVCACVSEWCGANPWLPCMCILVCGVSLSL